MGNITVAGMGKTLVMDMGITLVTGVGNYLVTAMGKILDFSSAGYALRKTAAAGFWAIY
jgi:hypothetical protein